MLQIEIITPERIVRTFEAQEVTLPTESGMIGVRTNHLPLVAPLKAGMITVKPDLKKDLEFEHLAVGGGFVEVLDNHVRVLAIAAEHAEEMDEFTIKEAMERAKAIKENSKDRREFASAVSMIEFGLARQKVAKRKKAHTHKSSPENIQ